jgi:hypothetical protein
MVKSIGITRRDIKYENAIGVTANHFDPKSLAVVFPEQGIFVFISPPCKQ